MSLFSCKAYKFVSMNNQECGIRSKTIIINNNKHTFYSYSIETNKYSGNCANINDPYAKSYVPDVI